MTIVLLLLLLALPLPLLCRFGWWKGPRLLLAQGMEDDSDMKIAPARPSARHADDSDRVANRMESELEKGNIVKARLLGISLAELFFAQAIAATRDAGVLQALQGDGRSLDQLDLLHAYATKIGLEASSPSPLVADTAFNVFMEEVRARDAALYNRICESEAFSLYLLCIRTAGRAGYTIGGVFARLCDREEDAALTAFGEAEYRRYLTAVEAMVDGTAFA